MRQDSPASYIASLTLELEWAPDPGCVRVVALPAAPGPGVRHVGDTHWKLDRTFADTVDGYDAEMSIIHFVGGEKGGVGKSVVARLLAQYFVDHTLPFVALDADGSHGSLLRHYADFTRAVDLSRFDSADEILSLATEADRRVLVDLPAQSDRPLSTWITEAGILDLARESQVQVVFWHVMDDGKDATITLDRLLTRYGTAAKYCIVKNLGRGKDFSLFDRSAVRALAAELDAHVIELPELHAPAMQKIDRFDASFWAAVNNAALGDGAFTRMDRQRVKVWLTAGFDQLARLGDQL